MSLDKVPELGSKPVNLSVKLPAIKNQDLSQLGDGLRVLYNHAEFTDMTFICADQTFRAHRCVLAAMSEVFRQGLMVKKGEAYNANPEVRLAEVSNPEAVKIMIDHIYQIDLSSWEEYNPKTQEINKDVLRLAQSFKLPGLTERATHWMAKGLTTGNVVERLTICEDFGLTLLREKILEQLTCNKRALAEVAHSPQIMTYPKLMQALLQQAASLPEEPKSTAQPTKKPRKA